MSTKREQILAKIKTELEEISAPTNLSEKVHRSLSVALDRSEVPCVVVEPVRDDPNNESIYRIVWRLRVRIKVIVRGAIPDQVADPIIESIHEKIMSDIELGGLCENIEPGPVNFELLDSDAGGGIFPIDYVVVYQTARESMTTI
jgi:hypothetical protein